MQQMSLCLCFLFFFCSSSLPKKILCADYTVYDCLCKYYSMDLLWFYHTQSFQSQPCHPTRQFSLVFLMEWDDPIHVDIHTMDSAEIRWAAEEKEESSEFKTSETVAHSTSLCNSCKCSVAIRKKTLTCFCRQKQTTYPGIPVLWPSVRHGSWNNLK